MMHPSPRQGIVYGDGTAGWDAFDVDPARAYGGLGETLYGCR